MATVITAGQDVLPEPKQDILPLSHLHSLSLSLFRSVGHDLPFLDHLATPALESLYLNFRDMHMDIRCWTQQVHFTAFQLRAPNITELRLQCSSLTSDDLRTAIRHGQSLTRLELSHCCACIDDALIDALCYKVGVGPLVPNLRILRLAQIGDNFTKDILAGMIASRWWTDAELALRSVPPAVARWTRVELWGDFAEYVIDIVKNRSSDIPISYCY
ncbi:hypothetical protein B0H12DRAFT_125448 [Mycena haematopus]|nr:hypothetical protein B0H12DRAFT_125448 [Mycena haematopus]